MDQLRSFKKNIQDFEVRVDVTEQRMKQTEFRIELFFEDEIFKTAQKNFASVYEELGKYREQVRILDEVEIHNLKTNLATNYVTNEKLDSKVEVLNIEMVEQITKNTEKI